MKRLVIIFLCYLCISFKLSAQNYIAEYQSENAKGRLLFNAAAWRYDVTERIGVSIESGDISLDEESSFTAKSVSTFNYRSLDKNVYLDEELLLDASKSLVIKGELEKPEWNIVSDSIKTIENYPCLMAKGYVRGRNYTVWFTPDIPVSAGPWKLWGLPGLIMNVRSDDGVVEITLISLKPTDLLPKEPTVKKTVTPAEFKMQFNEALKKFTRKIQGLAIDRDTEINVTNININNPDKSLFE